MSRTNEPPPDHEPAISDGPPGYGVRRCRAAFGFLHADVSAASGRPKKSGAAAPPSITLECACLWVLTFGVLHLSGIQSVLGDDLTNAPLQRLANTTITLPASLHSSQFRTVDAFAGVSFSKPVAVTSPPDDTNRLFVVEREGRIVVVTNLASPTRTIFLDITPKVFSDYERFGAEGLTSVTFHPDFRNNGLFFVLYKTRISARGSTRIFEKLARFQISSADPNRADPESEIEFMTQLDEGIGHSWNDLHFGADGYLYFAAGDEGESQDAFQNSARIDKDFYSAILRIDVDRRPESLAPNPLPGSTTRYAIPPDNPFIGAATFDGQPVDPAKVRTEFYAIGFRNPWRMSFDPLTGSLYCADVGQYLVEEINVIQKGGNYGWAYFEGTRKGFRGDPPPGYHSIAPIYEYPHYTFGQPAGPDQGNSVTGGIVYRGERIPELHGFYLFADFLSGHIWALRYDGTRVVAFKRLAFEQGIAAFGRDPRNGDVLLVNHNTGKIRTLDYSPKTTPLPQTLSETGIFADLKTLTPHPGIVPYDVNVPLWSDNASKRRWFSIPQLDRHFGFHSDEEWEIPEGAVFIKHFELELTVGQPQSSRRVETRLLVRQPDGIYGLTYRWDDSQQEALLVPDEGADEVFQINDRGTVREQVWRYPSRHECQICHAGGRVLGLNTPQFNREFNYDSGPANQIAALRNAAYFNSPITNIHSLRALAPLDDQSVSREYRVRSYLAANCAQCHQPGEAARGSWDARIQTPTAQASIIDGDLNNVEGHPGNKVIKSRSLEQSMILNRILRLGPGRMPPLGSNLIDQSAADLLTAWITDDLRTYQHYWQWQAEHFASTDHPSASATADPDQDDASNHLEYIAGTDPHSASDAWQVMIQSPNGLPQLVIPQPANRAIQVERTASLLSPIEWTPLDHPDNPLFFPSTNKTTIIDIRSHSDSFEFFRVRLLAP